jgi:uncharacterized protein (DUF2147 family)
MTRFFTLILLSLCLSAATIASEKSDYIGYYWNEEKDGIFKLALTNESIEGITVWGAEPKQDIHNPDPALKERSLGGILFLWGFTYDPKKNRWLDGRVYDPNSGKTYDAKIGLEKKGRILKMRGYLGMAMFGRTARFERVTLENAPADIKQKINLRLSAGRP